MRKAAKNLKIQLSRFESLEKLSRVGLDIDVATQATLQEGNISACTAATRSLFAAQYLPQVIMLTAVSEHWLSDLKPSQAVVLPTHWSRSRGFAMPRLPTRWIRASCQQRAGSERCKTCCLRREREQICETPTIPPASLADSIGAKRRCGSDAVAFGPPFPPCPSGVAAARQYREEMNTVIAEIGIHQPLHPGVPAGLLVIASDLGLCGDYNSRISRLAVDEIANHAVQSVYSVGRRSRAALSKRRIVPVRTYDAPASLEGLSHFCSVLPKMCWRTIWQ